MKGYRKLFVAVLALLLGFALALSGKLTTDYVALASAVLASFSIANTFEHKATGA